ncbi:hypothetical protein MMC07_000431 [Pseudocyphellaria aurata]|nr:hypothetical protein [Pseudocyphellaria aurata]
MRNAHMHSKHAQQGELSSNTAQAGGQPVVVLGSGLDSRPWRLPLPAHVAWFEVDWPDCISGKKARLAGIGAATSPGETHAKHPLKSASWAGVSTDLAQPGFIKDLEAAGFSQALPSVFLCEGLLYYLQPAQVDELLQGILVQTLAKAGPVGTTLLADAKDAAYLAHDAIMHADAAQAEKHWKLDSKGDFVNKFVATFSAAVPFDCTEQLAQAGWTLEAVTDAMGWAKAYGRTAAGDIGQTTQKGIATENFSAWSRRHWFILKAALY